jgi:hypothetical protein
MKSFAAEEEGTRALHLRLGLEGNKNLEDLREDVGSCALLSAYFGKTPLRLLCSREER